MATRACARSTSRRNGALWPSAGARISIELYDSGRWKHYYSEEQFLHRMREAIRLIERWAEIAPQAGG